MRSNSQTDHRPGSIEGYCGNIHKGKIRVGINIGNCAGYGDSNGHTGWNSVSRLIIEEVPRSQFSGSLALGLVVSSLDRFKWRDRLTAILLKLRSETFRV